MATSAPSFFNFLKEGFLLPSRNRGLFAAVCALILVSTTLLVLGNDLAVQPLVDEFMLDLKALSTAEQVTQEEYAKLLEQIENATKKLLLVGTGYLLFAVVVGSAVQIVVLFAAVLTYSGEERATTFGALLGQAKAQFKGPLLTLAFVYVLEVVYGVLVVAMAALLVFLMVKQYFVGILILGSLLVLAAIVCFVYFSFLCSFSVIVAVAEPGCHSVGAFGRAWKLVKGKKWQVVLYVAVTGALAAAVSPVRMLGSTYAGNSVALGSLVDVVYGVLLALVQLFAVCAMTAFYYERRENSDSHLGPTGYAKLAAGEANA